MENNEYFVVDIPIANLEKWQEDILYNIFKKANMFQNKLIKTANKQIQKLSNYPQYTEYMNDLNKLYNDTKRTEKDKEKERNKIYKKLNKLYKELDIPLGKYGLGTKATELRNSDSIGKYLPSNVCIDIATKVSQGVQSVIFSNGKKISFKKNSSMNFVTGAHPEQEIIVNIEDGKVIIRKTFVKISKNSKKKYYKKQRERYNSIKTKKNFDEWVKPIKNRDLILDLNIYNDLYFQEAIHMPIKYCSLKRKLKGTSFKYYVSLTIIGKPPKLKNKDGSKKYCHPLIDEKVGLDMGTSTVAIVSNQRVDLKRLGEDQVRNIDKKIVKIQKYMDRSRRKNNPDCFDTNGTYIKGKKIKNKSKNYIKAQKKMRYLYQAKSEAIRNSHKHIANLIIYEHGTDIRVETMRFSGLAKKSKETKREEKPTEIINKKGEIKKVYKYKKKKRFGKSINHFAPALLLNIIDKKLNAYDLHIKKIDTYQVMASQYNHFDDSYKKKKLSQRWNYFENGDKIQRDLYSAFLIKNTNEKLDSINRVICIQEYNDFKKLHDECILNIKNSTMKKSTSFGF